MTAIPWCDAGVPCRFQPEQVSTWFKARSGPFPQPDQCYPLTAHMNAIATVRLIDGKLPRKRMGRPDAVGNAIALVQRRVAECEQDLSLSLGRRAVSGPMGDDYREIRSMLSRLRTLLTSHEHNIVPPIEPDRTMIWHHAAVWIAIYGARAWRDAGRRSLKRSNNSPLTALVVSCLAEVEDDIRDSAEVSNALERGGSSVERAILADLLS